MLTFTKTKIGITLLILGAFILGGLVFSAYQVNAFGEFHRFGFFGGGCDLSGLEKDSSEWQAKIDECKSDRKAKIEGHKAGINTFKANWTQDDGWKNLTSEERQTKIDELKSNWTQDGRWGKHSFGFGHFRGFKGTPHEDN